MSRTGRSRPFHRDADGLLPAEGAAFAQTKIFVINEEKIRRDTKVGKEIAATLGTIRNPATGVVAGTVRWTDPADVARIAAGLREAQKHWEARGAKGRAKVMARYTVWLGEQRDEIAEHMRRTRETV